MKKTLLGIACIAGLALTLLPALFVFAGSLSFATHKLLMLLGFLLWFGAAPFWLGSEDREAS